MIYPSFFTLKKFTTIPSFFTSEKFTNFPNKSNVLIHFDFFSFYIICMVLNTYIHLHCQASTYGFRAVRPYEEFPPYEMINFAFFVRNEKKKSFFAVRKQKKKGDLTQAGPVATSASRIGPRGSARGMFPSECQLEKE